MPMCDTVLSDNFESQPVSALRGNIKKVGSDYLWRGAGG
jgi:hypothetical protein